jgi:hypothetical protein
VQRLEENREIFLGRESPGKKESHRLVGSPGTLRLLVQVNPIIHYFHGDPRIRLLRQSMNMAAGYGNHGRRLPDGGGEGLEPLKELICLDRDAPRHISQLGAEHIGYPGDEVEEETQYPGRHGKMSV